MGATVTLHLDPPATVADVSSETDSRDRTGPLGTYGAGDRIIRERYCELQEYAYQDDGTKLDLDEGLVRIVGKFTGGQQITMFILRPFLAEMLSRRQVRHHLKAEVRRRNVWYQRGGQKTLGDPAHSRPERRREIIEFHQHLARRQGWEFPNLSCRPEWLVSELADTAIDDWEQSSNYLGVRRFSALLYEVARRCHQFIDLRNNRSAVARLYRTYLATLRSRLEVRGIPLGMHLRRSLGMIGNRRRREGDRTVVEIAPANADIVPASGSGSRKGDLEAGSYLMEIKSIRSRRARVRGQQLLTIECQAESTGKIPLFILSLEHSQWRSLVLIIREDDTERRIPGANDPRATRGTKDLRLDRRAWLQLASGIGSRVLLTINENHRGYWVIKAPDLNTRTIDKLLVPEAP